MTNPLVSVIIPVYKVEPYIHRCIDSVINQTYSNLEIILVDDGSPDNCGKICDDYAQKDTRIKVIHKKNGGLSDARNSGLDICTGSYLTFIDSDDYVSNLLVQSLLNCLLKHHADIAECGYVKGKTPIMPLKKASEESIAMSSEQALNNWHSTYKHIETMAWAKLYCRNLFYSNDNLIVKYPFGYLHEDVMTTHKLVKRADTIAILNQALYFYTINTTGITNSSISLKRIQDYTYAQEQRLRFFSEQPYEQAYNRLLIFCAKGWMLNYCKGKKSLTNHPAELDNLLNRFFKNYKIIMHVSSFKEKLLFFLFKNFPSIVTYTLLPLYELYQNKGE